MSPHEIGSVSDLLLDVGDVLDELLILACEAAGPKSERISTRASLRHLAQEEALKGIKALACAKHELARLRAMAEKEAEK